MAVQYVDKNADAAGLVAEPYVISGTNNAFSIAIDGGSNQVFALTSGTRTAAQIVADLSALTSATASVVSINGAKCVRIRTTSNSGSSSTILVNAPTSNANSTLGFFATTYTGGTNINTTFTTSSTSDKQGIISGIEDALNSAGWITVSGHHSTPCIVQSPMSPNPQNLRMRLRMTVATNTAAISIENAVTTGTTATRQGTNNSSNLGAYLVPATSKTFRVIANKYQAFVFVPGTSASREFCAFGVPYLQTNLQGFVWEAIWLHGNMQSDTDTTIRGSFRTCLGIRNSASNIGNNQQILNGNIWENTGNNVDTGLQTLVTMMPGILANSGQTASWYRWHDSSAFITDPLIAWGLTGRDAEGMVNGQLWDSFITTENYTVDSTLTSFDSHNWWNITDGANTSSSTWRGCLWVATA